MWISTHDQLDEFTILPTRTNSVPSGMREARIRRRPSKSPPATATTHKHTRQAITWAPRNLLDIANRGVWLKLKHVYL